MVEYTKIINNVKSPVEISTALKIHKFSCLIQNTLLFLILRPLSGNSFHDKQTIVGTKLLVLFLTNLFLYTGFTWSLVNKCHISYRIMFITSLGLVLMRVINICQLFIKSNKINCPANIIICSILFLVIIGEFIFEFKFRNIISRISTENILKITSDYILVNCYYKRRKIVGFKLVICIFLFLSFFEQMYISLANVEALDKFCGQNGTFDEYSMLVSTGILSILILVLLTISFSEERKLQRILAMICICVVILIDLFHIFTNVFFDTLKFVDTNFIIPFRVLYFLYGLTVCIKEYNILGLGLKEYRLKINAKNKRFNL